MSVAGRGPNIAFSFANNCVAVTGANGGIGRVICDYLVGNGLSVYALSRSTTTGSSAQHHVVTDVTSVTSVAAAVAEVYETAPGPVDLVACAGISEGDVPAEDLSVEEFDHIMAVNVRGVFLSCQAFGRELLARGGGSIVNISSMSGNYVVNVPQKQSAYNTSKAAVTALTRSLAVEWGPRGVRVNSVAPGYVATRAITANDSNVDLWRGTTVYGRFAEPEEVAEAVAFLLSDGSLYCCGTELVMDGGYRLR